MSVMGGLTLTQRELARLQVLNRVLGHDMRVGEAAEVLGLSERHAWRILAAYRKEGAAALAHGNRGRRPANAIPEGIGLQVITLARTCYAGVNHTHLAELLGEREGLLLARSTVHSILVNAGVGSPRQRRPPRHRCRRERLPQEGMLLQLDGSRHEWLGDRGPWLTLLLAVDDATGTVPYALFREQEDTHGYFLLLRGIIERCGIPLAVYSDGHAIFRQSRRARTAPEVSQEGKEALTQFSRAMRELGIGQIFARSPEAKGRVERMAGTFQDRLVAELRLAGASTLAEANRILWQFLPGFNGRFGVPPAHPGGAYRPVAPGLDVAGVLCFKYRCKVARDNTVRHEWRTLQLLPEPERSSYAGKRVEVQKRLDRSLVVCYQGQVIPTQEAPPRPGVLRSRYAAWGAKPNTVALGLGGGVSPDGVGGQGLVWEGMLGAAPEEAAAGSSFPICQREDYPLRAPNTPASPWTPRRQPTPRKKARWDAIQEASRQALSLRAISKYLGISRNTVRRYVRANGPPVYPTRRPLCTLTEKRQMVGVL
jgi:transposase